MKLKLDFEPSKSVHSIEHGKTIVLLGSCFSDNLASYFADSGFKVISNPLGTIYHPLALSKLLSEDSIRVFEKNDCVYSWDASTKFFARNEQELINRYNRVRDEVKEAFRAGAHLFLTFGTCWGYELNNELVANCHKEAQSRFSKRLYEMEEMQVVWSELQEKLLNQYPKLEISYSVSPVRHVKDGLIENNRSKARLIELTQSLIEQNRSTSYFPAYEVVIDELRDYRFYAQDLVHPNDQAVEYIWEKLQNVYFDDHTQNLCSQIKKINQSIIHQSISESKIDRIKRLEQVEKKKLDLSQSNPQIIWK